MADGTLIFKTALDESGITKGLKDIKKTATAILGVSAKAIAAVTGALTAGAGAGVLYNSSIENYTTSFEVMTGSAEKAVQVVEELKKVGASTPFELTGLADTTQLLMNYGFTADDAIDSMLMLGDIAQGDADKLSRVAAAYGQMSSAGKVSLEDVKQMIEAGFNPLQEISVSTGESMASLYERISKGRIAVDEITDSMKRSTSEGGKYFQSMQKQSQTFTGQIATMQDTAQMLLGEVVQPISDAMVNTLIPTAISSLEELTEAFERDGVQGLIDAAGPMIARFVTEAAGYAPRMVELAIQLINALVEGITENLPQLMEAAKDIANTILEGIGDLCPLMEPVTNALQYMADNMDKVFAAVVPLTAAFVAYKAVFAVNTLIQAYNKVTKEMTIVQYAAKVAQDFLNTSFLACPVTWIVMALAAVVAAFVYLWNTSEGFRQFWINLWETIKATALEWGESFTRFVNETIPAIINSIVAFFMELPGQISIWLEKTLQAAVVFGTNMKNKAIETGSAFLKNILNYIQQLPGTVWSWLEKTIQKAIIFGTNMKNKAIETGSAFLQNILNYIQQLPGTVWSWLEKTIQKALNFVADMKRKATEAGKGFYNNIVSALSSLPEKMKEIGSNIVSGIWKGISDGWDWLTSKVKSLARSLYEAAKDALGIHSPSKKFQYIGEMCVEGMDEPLRKYNPYGTLKASLAAGSAGFMRGLDGGFTASGTVNNYSSTYNIYQPVKSPSELMRAARLEDRFGMAGG